MKIEFVPCTLAHIRIVQDNLRDEERQEISLVTGRPRRHLMIALWLRSDYRRALLVDGEVAAIGGDCSPPLSIEAQGWLFTTPLVEKIPVAFFRLMKTQTEMLLREKGYLRSSILASSPRCERFYRALGFEVREPVDGFRDIVKART